MTWFRVDDSFHSHPKVLAADAAALGLWVVAGTWCAANLTDGFVPDYVLPRLLPDAAQLAEKLVTCRLWRRARGGYRFHDWSDYNPSSEEVEKDREAARNRMRDLRAKRRANGRPAGQTVNGSGEQVANVRENFKRSSREVRDPVPTRPEGTGGKGDLIGGTSVTRASPDPPPRCQEHLDHPDPPPCGPCADHRRSRERWDRDHAAQAGDQQSRRARQQAQATRAAIDACRLCDPRGYRDGTLCAHDPDLPQRARRGGDAVRAALGRSP